MDEIRFITDNYLQTLRKELENAKPILQQDSQTEGDPEKKN